MRPLPETRVLTDHAVDRFRQRHGTRQTPVRVVAQVLGAARFQTHRPPVAVTAESKPDGYLVNGMAVFPVFRVLDDRGRPVLLATTCLKVRKRPKAERRALRELAREEGYEWAA